MEMAGPGAELEVKNWKNSSCDLDFVENTVHLQLVDDLILSRVFMKNVTVKR